MAGWNNDTPSGFNQTWKLWRHCCCRYGWYPLIVLPIVMFGCLLSLYSSFGCEFVEMEIGFTPSNAAWNGSSLKFGLFYMRTDIDSSNKYKQALYEGCQWYDDDFELSFIDGDRTWKVARIMAFIAGTASCIAMFTSFLFVFSPLPVSFFWPGVLLPALLIAFLAEGSKFLIFDTAVCRLPLWAPSGTNSLPRRVESCALGSTSFYTIAATSFLFLALMFVCLRAPDKRHLDEHYGRRYDKPSDLEQADSADDYSAGESYPRGSDVYVIGDLGAHGQRSVDLESDGGRSKGTQVKYARSESSSHGEAYSYSREYHQERQDTVSELRSTGSRRKNHSSRELTRERSKDSSRDGRESFSSKRFMDDSSRDDLSDSALSNHVSSDSVAHESRGVDRMSAAEIAIRRSEQQRISESRVSKIERMELNSTTASDELIEKFVSDLDLSFQRDAQPTPAIPTSAIPAEADV